MACALDIALLRALDLALRENDPRTTDFIVQALEARAVAGGDQRVRDEAYLRVARMLNARSSSERRLRSGRSRVKRTPASCDA
jgi:hypothetical protein